MKYFWESKLFDFSVYGQMSVENDMIEDGKHRTDFIYH